MILTECTKFVKAFADKQEDNSEEKDFVLFGVRSSDVKKLDKSTWVSFFDFYVDICKNIIRNNKKSVNLHTR